MDQPFANWWRTRLSHDRGGTKGAARRRKASRHTCSRVETGFSARWIKDENRKGMSDALRFVAALILPLRKGTMANVLSLFDRHSDACCRSICADAQANCKH